MRIGSLDKFIDLEAETREPDGSGGFLTGWTTVATNVNAAIWPTSAKDVFKDMQNVGIITHRIRIRYRRVLRSAWRISWAGRYFAIVAPPIDTEMNHRYLDILVKEAVL